MCHVDWCADNIGGRCRHAMLSVELFECLKPPVAHCLFQMRV